MRTLLIVLLLAGLALAAQYTYYNPFVYIPVVVQKSPNWQGAIDLHTVLVFYNFTNYCRPGYIGCVTPQWMTTPGVVASAWTPNGTPVEYVYKKAVAIFDIPKNITTDAIEWNDWIIYGSSLQQWGFYQKDLNHTQVVYALQVAIKLGNGPVLTCLKKVPWPIIELVGVDYTPNELYYADCPGTNASKVIIASVMWYVTHSGHRYICANWWIFWQKWWYDSGNYGYLNFNQQLGDVYCAKWPDPAMNITAVAGENAAYFYVDVELFYTLNTPQFSSAEPWLYTGPYMLDHNPTTAAAAVGLWSLPGQAKTYLGTFWLLIGNDTLAVPRYVTDMVWGDGFLWGVGDWAGGLEAGVQFNGFYAKVGPGATGNASVLDLGFVNATINGERMTVQRGTYFTCPLGEAVANGDAIPLGRGYVVAGPPPAPPPKKAGGGEGRQKHRGAGGGVGGKGG